MADCHEPRAIIYCARHGGLGRPRPHQAGFAVMGVTLTLNRVGQAGKALSIGLMTVRTALVFAGLYLGGGLW